MNWTALIRGMGTVLDMWGTSVQVPILSEKEAAEADARALASDWRTVGKDIRKAMGRMGTLPDSVS